MRRDGGHRRGCARSHLVWGVLFGVIAVALPLHLEAQASAAVVSHDTVRSTALDVSDMIRRLQPIRMLGNPPAVSQVVAAARTDSGAAMVPVTAALGLVDLVLYQRQLGSIFPMSRAVYPEDSITEIQRSRAADWVRRLNALPAGSQRYALAGWQRVPLAEVAAFAGNDSLARRTFDARIAELSSRPAEQSYALYQIIMALTDRRQDSARLVRNLAVAEPYVKMLWGLKSAGLALQHDSVTIFGYQQRVEDSLIVGYIAVGDTAQLFAHAQHRMASVLALPMDFREGILDGVYEHVFHALMQTPAGRARLAVFNESVLAIARRADAPPANTPSNATTARRRTGHLESALREWMDEIATWFATLNTPAPPLSAHLWFNTPDSVYSETPRARTFADGKVHVVMFSNYDDSYHLSILDRAQRHFGAKAEIILGTSTEGRVGPDAVSPGEEAVWLTQYFRRVHHYTMSVAIWAGPKRPSGFVAEGKYRLFATEPSPNDTPFRREMLGNRCLLIDARGMMRFFQPIETRRDEATLWTRIQQLVDEAEHAHTSAGTMSVAYDGVGPQR